MNFEWDPEKARRNLAQHGVTFADASTAFGDPLSITLPDPRHSVGTVRDERARPILGRGSHGPGRNYPADQC